MSETVIRFLSLQNVLRIHEDTIDMEGGAPGVRDSGLLASAVEMPMALFAGEYLHRGLAEMAAATLYHLCQNHPFVDGNKRVAAFSSVLFLALNGVSDNDLPDADALERLTFGVAEGTVSKAQVTQFFRDLNLTAEG